MGYPPWLALLAAAGTMSTAYFVGAVSIVASTQTRSVRGALNFTYMVVMAWLVLPSATQVLWPRNTWPYDRINELVVRPLNSWVAPTTPFSLWLEAQRGAIHEPRDLAERVGWMVGLQLAYGSLFTAAAVACLRSTQRGRERRAGGRGQASPTPRTPGPPRAENRRPCGDDPMLWKELFVSRVPNFYRHLGLAISLVLTGLLAWGTLRFAFPAFHELWSTGYVSFASGSARSQFLLYLRIVGTGIYLVYIFGVVSDAAAGLASEREKDTWISLISTPLTGREIVRAKMLGAVWGIRHTAIVLLALWLAGAAAGSVHPLALVGVLAEMAAFTWFASALGTWISLRAQDAMRAVALAMLVLVVLNAGSLLLTMPFSADRPAGYVGCSPFLLAASLASYSDVHRQAAHSVLGLISDERLALFWSRHGGELTLTCLAGMLVYALGAWALARAACRSFDAQLDRPPVRDEPFAERTPTATPKPHVTHVGNAPVRARQP